MQASRSSGGFRSRPGNSARTESYVLLQGGGASGREAFKLAIKEAVFRGQVRILKPERGSGLLGLGKSKPYLTDWKTPTGGRMSRRALERLAEVPRGDSARWSARREGRRFRASGGVDVRLAQRSYRDRVVQPRLVERGLLRVEKYKMLWVFSGDASRADRGRRRAARRDGRPNEGRPGRCRGTGEREPRCRARRAPWRPGALLLLTPEILPHVREARRRAAESTDPELGRQRGPWGPTETSLKRDERIGRAGAAGRAGCSN